jgi:hypothetical protein
MEEPINEIPITKLGCQLATNNLMLTHCLSKFMKFVQLTIV